MFLENPSLILFIFIISLDWSVNKEIFCRLFEDRALISDYFDGEVEVKFFPGLLHSVTG